MLRKKMVLCGGLCIFCIFSILHSGEFDDSKSSATVRLDVRASVGGSILHGTERISPVAEDETATATLMAGGSAAAGWTVGKPQYATTKLNDGWHKFTLTEGENSDEKEMLVLNGNEVVIHEGILSSSQTSQTWVEGKVHVVRHWVRVPADVTLTIEPNAVVKFCEDTGILVDGKLNAQNAVFTYISDDSIGGDTDRNGASYMFVYKTYEITGDGEIDLTGVDDRLQYELGKTDDNNISATVRLDVRASEGGSILHGTERISPMSVSETATATLKAGDSVTAGWTVGKPQYVTTKLNDGWHKFTLTEGENSDEREMLVLNGSEVVIHEGILPSSPSNQTWAAGKTHVVRHWVRVPADVTLTIEPNAVVKFCEDTGILVDGMLVADGSVLTMISDDSNRGDTDMNGAVYQYVFKTYAIIGDEEHISMDDCSNSLISGLSITNGHGSSETTRLDVRTSVGGRMLVGEEYISPVAEDENANAKLTVDGAVLAGWNADSLWRIDSTKLANDRWHVFALNEGYGTSETDMLPMNRDDVIVHEGILEENQAWAADKIHIVRHWVRVPKDVTLTVEAKAVVKFCEDTGILVEEGGKLIGGEKVLFTFIENDADGDDTDVNGKTVDMGYGFYEIIGNTEDIQLSDCIKRGLANLTEDTVWEDVIHVLGTLKIPNGVTLTIRPGAVVKFATGASLVTDGGAIDANGALFTHLADDSADAGGDTNGDGDATSPVHDAYKLTGFTPSADCDIRYKTIEFPKTIDGTPDAPTIIMGNRVYKVTQNVIIESDHKLVIDPGAILKMGPDVTITVQKGGILEALGNRAQPIVFTSINDDNHGGDTNEDGYSVAEEGAWKGIITNGIVTMDYCSILYAGAGQYSNQKDASLRCNAGTTAVSNSEISHSLLRLVYAEGDVTITNCLLKDARYGIQGNATVVNSVITKCTEYTLSGNNSTIQNTIFYNTANVSGSKISYSCFWMAGNAPANKNNIQKDPLFTDPENGDFTLKAGSPCIDAGDGTIAPEYDYWGNPRMDVVKVADSGTPNADGVCPDIGIYEMPGVYNGACPNMTVTSVTAPAEAEVGQSITVRWIITNEGNDDVVGPWRDVVVLQGDEALGGQIVTLGETTVNGIIRPLDSATIERIFTLPPLKAGNWRVGVTTNAYRDIYEVKRADNQSFAEETTAVTLPVWSSINNKFTVGGYGETGFALSKSNSARIVTITLPSGAKMSAYGADGYLPFSGNSDVKSVTLSDGRVMLYVPAESEDAYVTLANEGGSSSIATVSVANATLSLLEATPAKILNRSTSTMRVIGTGLTMDSVFKLATGATTVTGQMVSLENGLVAAVQFDVNGIIPGNYTLSVTEGGKTASLSSKINVTTDGVGPKLEAWLETPPSVRDGRIYTAWLCYKNSGDADMTMPMFEIVPSSTTNIALNISDEFKSESLFISGIGKTAPTGILKAGEENRIPFFFTLRENYALQLKTLDENYTGILPDGFTDLTNYRQMMSEAATRLNLRGREEYDSKVIQRFALRIKNDLSVAAISGYLKNSYTGEPLVGLTVVANDPNGDIAESVTDVNGYFQLQDLADAEYVMGVIGGNLKEEILCAVNNQNDLNSLSLSAMPYCKVHGYVQEAETGVGLSGVVVRLRGAGLLAYDEQTTTDDMGYFVFTRCPKGTYYLGSKGTTEYIGSTGIILKICEGLMERNERLEMKMGGSIYGVISMASSGERVTGGQVQAKDDEDNTYETDVHTDGSYIFDALPNAVYTVRYISEDLTSEDVYNVEIKSPLKTECNLAVVPTSCFYTYDSFGVTPHVAKFFLNDSKVNIEEIVTCEWDFDNDGVIDSLELEPNFTYNQTGEYTVNLTITDKAGNRHTSRKKNCISVETPVENKIRDNVLEWNKQADFETVSFNEDTLEFIIKSKTGKVINVGTVIVGEILNNIYNVLIVDNIIMEDDHMILKCIRGGVFDVFESCYFNVPINLTAEDYNPYNNITRNENVFHNDITVLDDSHLKIVLATEVASRIGNFVLYINPIKFRYNMDWTIDMAMYPEITMDLNKKLSLLPQSMKIPRKYIVTNKIIPIADLPVWLLFSFFIDINPKISLNLDMKMKYHCAFREKYLVHSEAKMDFPINLLLLFSKKGRSIREKLANEYPNLNLYTDFSIEKMDVQNEPTEFELLNGVTDTDFEAKGDVGFEIKPTCRLNLYEENILTVTAGFNGHGGVKAECGTSKPTKVEVKAGIGGFASFYMLDGDSPTVNKMISYYNSQPMNDVIYSTDENGEEIIDDEESLYNLEEHENLNFWKWLKGLKVFGGKKEWEDLWKWDFGTYLAPEPDYEVKPASGNAPLSVQFKAKDNKGVSTGLFEYNKIFPEIEAYHWNFGKKSDLHDDVFREDAWEVYDEKGTYKTSLRLSVSPIPSFMKKRKVVKVGEDGNPPPGGPGGAATGGASAQSYDPNEISGVIGLGDGGTQRFVKPGEWLDYTVYFENKSTAAAPAQEVWVMHNLSKWLDWSTLELGEIGFNNQIQLELKGKARGTVTVPQEGTNYHVQMNAAMDEATGEFTLYLRSYDKTRQAYGYWPESVYAGFLPPNDESHRGEGHFTFRVKVRDDAPDGAFINAEATIVFDANAPITTSPAWFNWVTTDENPTADAMTLRWDTSDDANGTTYVVNYWVGDPDPTAEGASQTTASDTLTTGSWRRPELEPGTYYWNVTKTNGDQSSTTSTWSFDIMATHTLTVHGGIGSGSYSMRTMVTAEATPVTGKTFTGWTAVGLDMSEAELSESHLVFYMPDHDVELTANFVDTGNPEPIQRLDLTAGWNWVGFHVLPDSHKVGDVLGTAGFSPNDIVQTSGSSTRFTGATWLPGSYTLDYGRMYQIYASKANTVLITGVENTSPSVPLVSGWNWISNPTDEAVAPSQLTHSAGWTVGDRIQGIGGTVTFAGSRWLPSNGLSLEPGKGYQLFTDKEGILTFQGDPMYTVAVTNGIANKTMAYAGDTITVTANAPADGTVFDGWVSNDVDFADYTAMTTTFTMPAKNVSVAATYVGDTYTITMVNGTANKTTARAGETVTITADTPAAGNVFDKWTGDVEFVNASQTQTTFTMPAKNVTVTATYVYVGETYTITVNNGTANKTTARAGETVTITADTPAAGNVFDKWTGNVTFANAALAQTTFTMPAKNVTVTATYVGETYTITVNNGTANKTTARAGETVTITAATPAADKLFSKWTTSSGVTFASATSATTTFSMPAKNVSVTATYVDKTFAIAVVSGTADKTTAKMGDTVTVTANDPANGMIFDRWVSDDVVFADETSMTTTFTMPAKAVTVTATYIPDPNVVVDDTLYAIVDLSGGVDATNYPVRYSAVGPDLSDDTCRTTELWLRKIPAGTFTMGSPTNEAGHQSNETPHDVTLTQDAYIGVFECTQKQWELVMGQPPCYFSNRTCYATRPAEYVSFVDIRGSSSGVGWPENGHLVDATSFMGKLRARTGLMFDLPTEALWEYACRAGTNTALNTGRNLTNPSGADDAMAEAGRYRHNGGSGYSSACTDEYGTAKVGSYLPNAWGLYDMHGNVSEWCLDRFGEYGSETTDPVGAETGTSRVKRGGDWNISASKSCRSASRQKEIQTKKINSIGFRISLLLSE